MNRTQLRKLLTDKVKLKYDFLIVSCDHEKGSINIKIPKYIKDNSGSIYDYNLDGLNKNDLDKHKQTLQTIKDILNDCCKKLQKHKFKITERIDFNITFMFPEEYRTKKKMSYNDICTIMESYVPNKSIM